MAMTNQIIEGRGAIGFWFWVFSLLGIGLLSWGVAQSNQGFILGSAVPLLLGLALFWSREKPIQLEILSNGLNVQSPFLSIPFSDIQGVCVVGKSTSNRFAIELGYGLGKTLIPSLTNVGSRKLYDFLVESAGLSYGPPLPSELENYQAVQTEKFGPEKILACTLSQGLLAQKSPMRSWLKWYALALGGVIWIAGAMPMGKDFFAMSGWGILFLIIGLSLGIVTHKGGNHLGRVTPIAGGFVISPLGFALADRNLKGEMKWHEVKQMKLVSASAFDRSLFRIDVVVEGANISIQDIFHPGIHQIYLFMTRLWRPDGLPVV